MQDLGARYLPEVDLTHRTVAVETYNAAWSLLVEPRDDAQDRDLLGLAMTSRYHWGQVGGAQERVTADWMVSRCCADLGEGPLALAFGRSALAGATPDMPPWLRASLHEGLARAAAAAGDAALRGEHLEAARATLAEELDEEDRAVILSQIDSVPPPVR